MTKTDIAEFGKFGLIDHLSKNIKLQYSSSVKGIGDDAAILNYKNNNDTVIASSLLLEGINFDLMYVPLKHLGYKAAVEVFSKIYAMNAFPRQILLNLGISKRFSLENIEEFKEGFSLACETYEADIVGLDISSSYTGLSVAVTAVGEAIKGEVVYRSNAQNTDLICVSGDFGAAYMGLQLLEREKSIYASQQQTDKNIRFEPDFAGKEYLLERQLKPEARKDIIRSLREKFILATSMIEVKDGLASSLIQICKSSYSGCKIFEERIPIDYQTAAMAEEFNMNVTTVALNGGDDYELLFTVPLSSYEDISTLPGIRLIGHITEEKYGMLLETRDGAELALKAQGWKE